MLPSDSIRLIAAFICNSPVRVSQPIETQTMTVQVDLFQEPTEAGRYRVLGGAFELANE